MDLSKHVLVIGITMAMGGTEKALLSFLEELHERDILVSLLLAEHRGPLMGEIPPYVSLLPPLRNGKLFSLSRRNALGVFASLRFPGKRSYLVRHRKEIYRLLRGQSGAGERFFLSLMNEAIDDFSKEYPDHTYDAALAFAGDRTMFYLCDKIDSPKKLAWLHFDYRYPHREDAVYAPYFARCDAVISVSHSCTHLLSERFPHLKDHFITKLNRLPIRQRKKMIPQLRRNCLSKNRQLKRMQKKLQNRQQKLLLQRNQWK